MVIRSQRISGKTTMAAPISNEEQVFITELGRRSTALRKDAGMTQTQVAQALNVSQQAVQAWEAGRRRIQISILPAVARLLAVSLEDLLGEEPEKIARKRGPAPKWQQLIEEIDSLPKAKQKMISEMLQALIVQARN